LNGAFSLVLPQVPGPGLLWDTTDLGRTGQLRVKAGTLPQITAVNIRGNSIIINGTGGSLGLPGKAYYVLTSTNISLPLPEWQRLATNEFDDLANFSFTNTVVISRTPIFFALETR
jgi:hypothetical protein